MITQESSCFRDTAQGYLNECFETGRLDRRRIQDFAGQISVDGALGESIALIPVAGDEYRYIPDTVKEYADQDTPEGGFSLVLGLNRTAFQATEEVKRTRESAYRAKDDYPNLDLRIVDLGLLSKYKGDRTEKNCLLPEIREELAAVVLSSLVDQENTPEEVLLHMHDIDLASLSPGYFAEMREAHLQNPGKPLMPNARHAFYPNTPNINILIGLCDLDGMFSHNQPPIFEAAFAMPGTTYIGADGYNGRHTEIGGTIDLVGRTGTWPEHVPDAELQSSGRRLALNYEIGFSPVVWTEQFEPDDLAGYRTKDFTDIPPMNIRDFFNGCLPNISQYRTDIREYVENLASEGLDFEEARKQSWSWVRKRLEAAQSRIEEVDELLAGVYGGNEKPKFFEQLVNQHAHGIVVDTLERKYETGDLDALVKGCIPEVHDAELDLFREKIRKTPRDEVYSLGDLYKQMYYRKVRELDDARPLV